jgi:hypothetical protein
MLITCDVTRGSPVSINSCDVPGWTGTEKSNHRMIAFTIDSDNNITVHPNKKIARQTGAGVFDTAASLAELIGADNKRLVEIWNSLTGVTPVKKFTSGAVAARRIFAEVQKLASPAGSTTDEPEGIAPATKRSPRATAAVEPMSTKKTSRKTPRKTEPAAKPGSKREILFGLISRRSGASLEELMVALGWQKHSVRGFIATLGKTIGIESFKTEQGVRTYRAL